VRSWWVPLQSINKVISVDIDVAELRKLPEAQEAFYQRARLNGAARYGQYSIEMEAVAT